MIITALAYIAVASVIFTLIILVFGLSEQDDDLMLVALLSIAWPAVLMVFAFACIIGAVFKVINTIVKIFTK